MFYYVWLVLAIASSISITSTWCVESGGFRYKVNDFNGNEHSHDQNRHGNAVRGQYKVLLPDGRLQTVSYIADEDGYRAKVDYSPANTPGEATTADASSPPDSSASVYSNKVLPLLPGRPPLGGIPAALVPVPVPVKPAVIPIYGPYGGNPPLIPISGGASFPLRPYVGTGLSPYGNPGTAGIYSSLGYNKGPYGAGYGSNLPYGIGGSYGGAGYGSLPGSYGSNRPYVGGAGYGAAIAGGGYGLKPPYGDSGIGYAGPGYGGYGSGGAYGAGGGGSYGINAGSYGGYGSGGVYGAGGGGSYGINAGSYGGYGSGGIYGAGGGSYGINAGSYGGYGSGGVYGAGGGGYGSSGGSYGVDYDTGTENGYGSAGLYNYGGAGYGPASNNGPSNYGRPPAKSGYAYSYSTPNSQVSVYSNVYGYGAA